MIVVNCSYCILLKANVRYFLFKKGSKFVSEGQLLAMLWKRGLLHLFKHLFREGKQFINKVRVKLMSCLIRNIRRPVP